MMNMKAFFVLYAYVIALAIGLSWLFGTIAAFLKGI